MELTTKEFHVCWIPYWMVWKSHCFIQLTEKLVLLSYFGKDWQVVSEFVSLSSWVHRLTTLLVSLGYVRSSDWILSIGMWARPIDVTSSLDLWKSSMWSYSLSFPFCWLNEEGAEALKVMEATCRITLGSWMLA